MRQDDFLDCFGDPQVIGKIGTDIEDNKCSWLIVKALELASPEDRAILAENYGRKDASNVLRVKETYRKLKIDEKFNELEEVSSAELQSLIAGIDPSIINPVLFQKFFNRIYKRSK